MTAIRIVRLWCDHYDKPDEGRPYGHSCNAEFEPPPDLGFIKSLPVMRREAAKAGWTYVRHPSPNARSLDKDFCPMHKPALREA